MDLSSLETQVLTGLASLVLLATLWGIQRGLAWFNIQLSAAQKQSLEDVGEKSLTYGITQAKSLIAAKGWDHVDVQNQVVALAGQYAAKQFSDTLERAGVDTSSVGVAASTMAPLLTRMFPAVALTASASPTTPPAPPAPPASVINVSVPPPVGR